MQPNTANIEQAFLDHLHQQRQSDGPKPTSGGTILRSSQAGKCARQIGFAAFGVEKDFPVSDKSMKAFNRGDQVHAELQAAVLEPWGGQVEVPMTLDGLSLSGDADGLYEGPLGNVVVEIKTMKEYGFYLHAIGKGHPRYKNEKQTPGPKVEHLLQAGIYAEGLDAQYVHVVYVNKSDDSMAEWLIDVDEPLDHLDRDGRLNGSGDRATVRQLVADELDRLKAIEATVLDGLLPDAVIPHEGTVSNPPEHHTSEDYDRKDGPWMCQWCDWRDTCDSLPSGEVEAGWSVFDRPDVTEEQPLEEAA